MRFDEIANSEIPTDIMEMIMKLRKNSTGFLNPSKLFKIIQYVPGWKMEKGTFIIPTEPEHLTEDRYEFRYVRYNDGEVFTTVIPGDNDEREQIEKLHALVKEYAVDKLPPPDKLGKAKFFVTNLGDIKEEPFEHNDNIRLSFTANLFTKERGHIITAPNDETFILTKQPGYRIVVMTDFFKWANPKDGDLNFRANAMAAAGLGEIEKNKYGNRRERDLANTGTCGVCGGNYKMKIGRLVDHGFTIPRGWGGRQGKCFGVGYEPFEVSPKACQDYIKLIKGEMEKYSKLLNKAKDGKLNKLMVKGHGFRAPMKEITPKDSNWDRQLKMYITNIEGQLRAMNSDLERYTEIVNNWKPDDLPEERERKRKER